MPWNLLAAALTGVLLGLRFRVPALLATSALVAIVGFAGGMAARIPLHQLLAWVLALVLTLQASYLASAFLTSRWKGPRVDK